jgi:hypothetical protein
LRTEFHLYVHAKELIISSHHMPRGLIWTQILRLGTQICCHASISMDCLVFSQPATDHCLTRTIKPTQSSTSCQQPWCLTMTSRFSSSVRVAPHTHPSRRPSSTLPNIRAGPIISYGVSEHSVYIDRGKYVVDSSLSTTLASFHHPLHLFPPP